MQPYKLHIKIGPHEFHGEGPEDAVKRDFDEWKNLISLVPIRQVASQGFSPPAPEQIAELNDADQRTLSKVFAVDDRRDLVSLRTLPRTDDRDADALLLVLLGYRFLKNQAEVLVTQLKPALRQSGCMVDRVDRVAARPVSQGFLHKGGLGKGGRYSLTNSGLEKAKALLNSVVAA